MSGHAHPNAALIDGLYAAFRKRDARAMAACYQPDATFRDPIFDVTGASLSHAVSGDGVVKALVPLLIGGLVVASWALRPASRKLASPGYASVPVAAQRTARSLA